MKSKNVLILLVIAIVLLITFVIAKNTTDKVISNDASLVALFETLDIDKIDHLVITDGNSTVNIKKMEGNWIVEEKSNYDVVLTGVGEKKIPVIKAVRSINQSLGLKEAKELVESAPKTVIENLAAEDAQKAKATLEEAGATIELK